MTGTEFCILQAYAIHIFHQAFVPLMSNNQVCASQIQFLTFTSKQFHV